MWGGGGVQHAVVSVAQVVYHSEYERHTNAHSGIHECALSIHFLLFFFFPPLAAVTSNVISLPFNRRPWAALQSSRESQTRMLLSWSKQTLLHNSYVHHLKFLQTAGWFSLLPPTLNFTHTCWDYSSRMVRLVPTVESEIKRNQTDLQCLSGAFLSLIAGSNNCYFKMSFRKQVMVISSLKR